MTRERLKTIVLSILIVMSALLTQQIWFYSPVEILQSEAFSRGANPHNIRENIISPKKITLGFGGGIQSSDYTILPYAESQEVWEYSKLVLEDFFMLDPEINQISGESYIKHMGLKHVELEFGENISSVLVSSIFNNIDSKIVRNIREVKKILIPAINRGTIYIVGKDDNTYEIKLQNYTENRIINEYMNQYEEQDFIKYYRLLLVSFKDNYTLMPLNFTPLPKITMESVIDVEDERILDFHSEVFFDKNLDFVRIIRETNGAVVYLYGYGEKTLRISPRGRLEYNEEVSNSSSTNVMTALDTAIEFIEKHGILPETAYLAEVRQIKTEHSNGYFFGFNYFVDGYPMAFSSNNMKYPIEVEVFGSTIKNYRSFVRRPMSLPTMTRLESIISPHKVIGNNIKLFESDITDFEKDSELEEADSNNDILRNISSIQMVYFDTMEEKSSQTVLPTWQIKVNNRVYYFDSYKGELLHSGVFE
ncbi:two-component system activity regulator YycH [Alkaliphilus peptidifermentans]|uniref:Two-component signal transduction system YycFG, regulatory protein YycH n=1 Tax=Alkaliphilus peptidifermentans DSM 18978 TaxID=1120976 RepID=A0A1G5HCZ0_9FIRM|nr:two-component system activity regulator YycH [Alkaliphilus peptidifermentans]SCY61614.1 Two-component signal transduction system YycFG, regulatory protein YycH [Alkaliphilus peptidifermentans DSM 18978]